MAARNISRQTHTRLVLDKSKVQDETREQYNIESKYDPAEYSELSRSQFDYDVSPLLQIAEEDIRKYSNSDDDGNNTYTGDYYADTVKDLYAKEDESNQERFSENPQNLLAQGIEDIKTKTEPKSCTYCSIKRRVEDVKFLKKGQHISISGEKCKFYLEFSQKQVKLYSHHAIVKEVVSCSDQCVKLVLIHFWRDENKALAIRETTETFDLKFDELYIIEYLQPRYTPDEIVLRAEKEKEETIAFQKYNLVSKNCEHFATWCVIGEGSSFQIHNMLLILSNALSALFGEGSKIAHFILRLTRPVTQRVLVSSDEMAARVNSAAGHITLGVTSGLYLIYLIVMTVKYITQYRNRKMCWSCLKHKLLDLWFRFGIFGITSMTTYLVIHFALPLLTLSVSSPVLCLLLVLSTALFWLVPKIAQKFQSPLQLDRKQISALTELNRGDIVNFKYYKVPHYFIVTDVKKSPHPLACGKLKCIHYALPGFCSKGIVTEEVFDIDVNKISVKRIDFGNLNTYSSREVVRRARKRVGETKWNAASNRSDHLCHWAKVDLRQLETNACLSEKIEEGDSNSKTLSSLLIETKEVHLMQEIHRGDVIQLHGESVFRDKGILVGLTDLRDGRKFELQIIMSKDRVRLVREIVDLDKHKLFVRRYHPAHCVPMEERAQRAHENVDKPSKHWFQFGFIKDCLLIKPEMNKPINPNGDKSES